MVDSFAWSDEAVMIRIGNLLRIGVVASAIVIVLGGVMHLYHHGGEEKVDRSLFKGMPAEFSHPGAIVRAALLGRGSGDSAISLAVDSGHGRGRALIQLGLLLLIATPVLRVAFSVFAFARKRDLVYVVLPLIVLVVLLYSLFSKQIH